MSLAWIPKDILSWIQKLCCRFLWNGHNEGRPFAWVGWAQIALPKKWGGWGLKYLPSFVHALAANMGWHYLSHFMDRGGALQIYLALTDHELDLAPNLAQIGYFFNMASYPSCSGMFYSGTSEMEN